MRSTTKRAAVATLALWLAGGALPGSAAAQSEDPHAHHAVPAPAPEAQDPGTARETLDIPDVEVLDQEGRRVRFASDLLSGRVVAINFLFTNCTTICPPLAVTFGKLRKLLGERAGRDVHLISVSVDPTNDTPERLKAWSQKFGAGPGWTLITGQRDEIVRLLKALGAYTADINDHPPQVLIGNPQGQWTRAYGLGSPGKLITVIDEMSGTATPQVEGARP